MTLLEGWESLSKINQKSRITIAQVNSYSVKLVEALNILHADNVTHGNLSLNNIYAKTNDLSYDVKLSDFANQLQYFEMHSIVGSPKEHRRMSCKIKDSQDFFSHRFEER